jgi:SOS-response transcriptional repressor LexA
MRRRRYLDKGEAMSRLIKFIAAFQSENLIAPTIYAMAAAVGTSHSQAKRLLREAEEAGILRRSSQSPLRFDIILDPPHLPGTVRIPVVECLWSKQIVWVDSETRGVRLDRAAYKISGDAVGYWALTFPELPRDGMTPNLRLNEHALALVRLCKPSEIAEGHWYVVEFKGRVIVSSFYKRAGRTLIFRIGPGDTSPDRIALREISSVAEVMMVTTRPPMPSQPPS